MKMPIVICTDQESRVSDILVKSLEVYAPEYEPIIYRNNDGSFGAAMNNILEDVFLIYDEVIIANDDVVITPYTMPTFIEDIDRIKKDHLKIGFIVTLADNTRRSQNIRCAMDGNDYVSQGKWISENYIKIVPVVAPIFAYFTKKAFSLAKFPPIDWFSDDIICEDLKKAGFDLFVSRAYVHHAGSATIGKDYEVQKNKALKWIEDNRPEYLQEMINRSR
jgi:hypothetical protein